MVRKVVNQGPWRGGPVAGGRCTREPAVTTRDCWQAVYPGAVHLPDTAGGVQSPGWPYTYLVLLLFRPLLTELHRLSLVVLGAIRSGPVLTPHGSGTNLFGLTRVVHNPTDVTGPRPACTRRTPPGSGTNLASLIKGVRIDQRPTSVRRATADRYGLLPAGLMRLLLPDDHKRQECLD